MLLKTGSVWKHRTNGDAVAVVVGLDPSGNWVQFVFIDDPEHVSRSTSVDRFTESYTIISSVKNP